MNKVPINENFIVPTFQTVNKNQYSTQLTLMDPQNGQLYLLHQYYCTRSQDYSNLITLLQTQANNDSQCQYILNPVVYLPIRFTNAEFQTSHFVQVLYQYGSHTLSQQMYLRIQEKNYFEQHEIWSILGSCVLGLKSLKDKQFNHSSICLNDIFVTKQGQIKLSHPMLRTYDHYHNQILDKHYLQSVLKQNYYFSPQQLSINQQNHDESLVLNESTTIDDFFKCDIFSLGMSVLTLCLLRPVGECYVRIGVKVGYNNFCSKVVIDSNVLQQYLYELEQAYSYDLITLLATMLTYQPLQRISIDQLAQTIQQMIQPNSQLQQQSQHRDQFYNEQNQSYMPASSYMVGDYNCSGQYQSNKSSSIGKYNQKDQQQQLFKEESQPMSSSRFGNFSRVSQQASPISGRKTKYSTYKQPKTGGKVDLMPCEPDNQDKTSPQAIQCMNDYENIDKPINQDQHMVESQRYSFHPYQNVDNQKVQDKTPTIKSSQYSPPSSSSINQTLKQYINHESESSVSQVNQTRTYEEYNKAVDAKLAALPKQIISVMTSKQLCSLPSNSISFVEEKHGFWKSQNKSQQKENQMNLMNNIGLNINNEQFLTKSNVNVKGNQNQSNSHYIDLSKVKTQYLHPLSSRTYIKKGSTNKKSQQENLNQDHNQYKINTQINNIGKNQPNNIFSITFSKDYQNLLKNQNNNPNSLYTDPKFLQAIRQDVNKILTKRGLQVTSSRNSMKEEKKQSFSNNKHVFINGKKVNDNNNYQPLYSPYKPYEFQNKPIFYR